MRLGLQKLVEAQAPQLELPLNRWPQSVGWKGATIHSEQSIQRLRAVDWSAVQRRTYGTIHGLHPYPTRFIPGFPAKLIEIFSSPGGTVLDPFCGSGTTVVEALRLGRRAVGLDVSPIALLLSRVKSTKFSAVHERSARATSAYAASLVYNFYERNRCVDADLTTFEQGIQDFCSRLEFQGSPLFPYSQTLRELSPWFSEHALIELLLIRIAIDSCPLDIAKDLLRVALSSIIVRVSAQKSETRRTKVAQRMKALETLNLWRRKVIDLEHLLAREQSHLGLASAELHEGDARNLFHFLQNSVDLVVTSPPYPNAYDYRAFQRLQLLVLGLAVPNTSAADIGSPRRYGGLDRTSFDANFKLEMVEVLGSLRHVLKPGGMCAFIVAPSRIKRELIDHTASLRAAAAEVGFKVLACVDPGRSSTSGSLHSDKPSAGSGERIVLFQI